MKKITQFTLRAFVLLFSCIHFLNSNAQTVTTFAGSTVGFADGIGTEAEFSQPRGVAVAADGTVLVADTNNHRIRKITADGVVSTLAGSTQGFADGTGTAAQFYNPFSVAVATDGTVFVADSGNHLIRKITAAGVVTTLAGSTKGFADGIGTEAKFNRPWGVAVAADGTVFVADTNNYRIRKITATGAVSTLAGGLYGFADGTGTAAQFNSPYGVAVDINGTAFVADSGNHRIRKITTAGVVTTLAGSTKGFADGIGTEAHFSYPDGIAVDASGTLFVGDEDNQRIRKITTTGVVNTLAGTGTWSFADGPGITASFYYPAGVAVASDGSVFVADTRNNRIRKITTALATTNFQLENQISLYPNPTSSIVNLELNGIIANKITIFDINGRTLQYKNILENKNAIDISNLSNGIYLMQISTSKGTISKKIVKQ